MQREVSKKVQRKYSKSSIESSYNEDNVFYCNHCKSLRIGFFKLDDVKEVNYCLDCNSMDIADMNIFDWLELTEKKVFRSLIEMKSEGQVDSIKQEIEDMISDYYQY